MRSVYFNEKDLASRMKEWRQISWQLIEAESVNFKKWMAENIIEKKFSEALGAESYERCEGDRPYRNGHYTRSLQLQTCRLTDIKIPRAEGFQWDNPLIEKFQRKSTEFEKMVYDGFVLGLSSRDMRRYLENFFQEDVLSQQGVSDICDKFTREKEAWHRRPITQKYRYIYWDGKWVKVKGARKHKKVVLKVMGISEDGACELLDFRVASSESALFWSEIAQSLYDRGLICADTELFIHDGAGGLIETLVLLWPDVKKQMCKVHHLRNLSKRIKKSVRRPMMKEAGRIYKAKSLEEAEARAQRFEKRWGMCEPNAVRIFMKGIESTLTFYRLGWDEDITKEERQDLWASISSTNILERLIEEDVRRIRSMRCFRNNDSCDRIFYALAKKFNENPWRLPGFVPKRKSAEILT
ncbi:MAG: IS256 family transposase [Elusimicrobia bacterium]|nr:IS256 family transposase [Elusimicrobiota bacterium]